MENNSISDQLSTESGPMYHAGRSNRKTTKSGKTYERNRDGSQVISDSFTHTALKAHPADSRITGMDDLRPDKGEYPAPGPLEPINSKQAVSAGGGRWGLKGWPSSTAQNSVSSSISDVQEVKRPPKKTLKGRVSKWCSKLSDWWSKRSPTTKAITKTALCFVALPAAILGIAYLATPAGWITSAVSAIVGLGIYAASGIGAAGGLLYLGTAAGAGRHWYRQAAREDLERSMLPYLHLDRNIKSDGTEYLENKENTL